MPLISFAPVANDYNVDVTRRVVEISHVLSVSVEHELGCLSSLETGTAGEEDGVGAVGTLDHAQPRCAGQASKIKVQALAAMAQRYAKQANQQAAQQAARQDSLLRQAA